MLQRLIWPRANPRPPAAPKSGQFSVVTGDGFLPLPEHVRADLPPGTLVRFHRDGDGWTVVPGDGSRP